MNSPKRSTPPNPHLTEEQSHSSKPASLEAEPEATELPDTRPAWEKKQHHAQRRLNLAWWFHTLSPPLILTTLLGACTILILRRHLPAFSWEIALLTTFSTLLLLGLLSWLLARKHFATRASTLVRLEASMQLNNALTAADQGHTPWPPLPRSKITDGTHWNWPRLITPLFASLLIISLSFLLPISAKQDLLAAPPEEPRAWQDLEDSLDALNEDNTVQEDYLEEQQKQIEQLRQQDADDWFSHSSMEASDELKKAHGNAMQELKRNMQRAEQSLSSLTKKGTQLNPANKERLMNQLDNALQQMQQGQLKPNTELLKQLGQIDPANLNSLSEEQLDQLRKNMRENAQQLQQAQQEMGGNQAQDWQDQLDQEGGGGG